MRKSALIAAAMMATVKMDAARVPTPVQKAMQLHDALLIGPGFRGNHGTGFNPCGRAGVGVRAAQRAARKHRNRQRAKANGSYRGRA